MSRRELFFASLAALFLSACEPPPTEYAGPEGIHRAPVNQAVLSPGRNGEPTINSETSLAQTSAPAAANFQGKVIRVGLLLPLTGRNADLGRALQDAATVALFDKYARLSVKQNATRVELLPKDTGDTPEQAVAAANQAIADGAELIIGPVFADATQAVAPIANAKNIQVISFSNNHALASPGVYPFGFSPAEQTARVIAFAQRHDRGRIAALVPNNSLGETVLAAARSTLAKNGMALVREVKYAPQGSGIETALSELVPAGATPDFDALLLPEGGASLGTILRALNGRGVAMPKVQLLGTGIWDDATLIRRTSLDGAWLASSPPASTAQFEQRFVATYNYVPPRIASLAYDAVALAVTLATSGRKFDQASLTNNAGFSGPANGIFRLNADGSVERSLAVLRVDGATLNVIDPAPTGFSR